MSRSAACMHHHHRHHHLVTVTCHILLLTQEEGIPFLLLDNGEESQKNKHNGKEKIIQNIMLLLVQSCIRL